MTKYPEATGFTAGSATSEAAAKDFDQNGRNKQREFAENYLRSKGEFGLTGEELRSEMVRNGFETMERAQASARLSDLCALDPPRAYVTDRSRISTFTGKPQQVVVHKDFATIEEKTKEKKPSLKNEIRADLEMAANFINGLVSSKAIDGNAWGKRAVEIETILRKRAKDLS